MSKNGDTIILKNGKKGTIIDCNSKVNIVKDSAGNFYQIRKIRDASTVIRFNTTAEELYKKCVELQDETAENFEELIDLVVDELILENGKKNLQIMV